MKTPQYIVESIVRRMKKKRKARRKRKLAKFTRSGKNNRRHKQTGYGGARNQHSCRSWR